MPSPAKTFGRYTVVRPIGRGGMGVVFEAEHVHLRKRVALKTLHHASGFDEGAIERFLREGRAAARVRHPHVVDVTDVGVEGGVPYLVMELLEGESLAEALRRRASLPVAEALDLLVPVFAAVDAMHRAGVVHRDLKPDNIFLARVLGATVPKVLDFGVCRPDDAELRGASSRGGLVGTPYYLSPEQVDGARGDARSDQHALAVVLYECLCGVRPYEAPTLLGLLARIRDARFDDPGAHRGDLPPGLVAALVRALSPDADARFESVRAFGEALLPYASDATRTLARACFFVDAQAPTDAPATVSADTVRFGSPTPRPAPTSDPTPAMGAARPPRAMLSSALAATAAVVLIVGLLWGVAPRGRAPSPPAARPTVVKPPPAAPPPAEPARPTAVAAPAPPRPVAAAPRRAPAAAARVAPPAPAAPRPAVARAVSPPERPVINGAPIVD